MRFCFWIHRTSFTCRFSYAFYHWIWSQSLVLWKYFKRVKWAILLNQVVILLILIQNIHSERIWTIMLSIFRPKWIFRYIFYVDFLASYNSIYIYYNKRLQNILNWDIIYIFMNEWMKINIIANLNYKMEKICLVK